MFQAIYTKTLIANLKSNCLDCSINQEVNKLLYYTNKLFFLWVLNIELNLCFINRYLLNC